MTTEQYQNGYEEGYQAGWNAAMDATPASKPWVSLTDEERKIASWTDGSFGAGARWAEAKLREKNGGGV